MHSNFVRQKLRNGEPSIGTWITIPSPAAATLMARTGFDWLTIELEHTPISFETAATCFSIIAGFGKVPLVRIPLNTTENIKRVLDTGAFGVIVPLVNSRAEAEAAVAAARYRPLGCRTIGGQLPAANFNTDASTYRAKANEEILVIVMLEQIQGVEKADEILSVPGIDAFFIGPNDLHNSLGKPPVFDSDEPEFIRAIDHLLAMGKKHKVPAGIHVVDAAAAQKRLAQGFQFIAVASEAGMMMSKAAEISKSLGLGSGKALGRY